MAVAMFSLLRYVCLILSLPRSRALAWQQLQWLRAAGLEGDQAIMQDLQEHRGIIICNAFADSGALEATITQSKEHIQPLRYKQCTRVALRLNEGDKLDFRCRGIDVGSFGISGVPTNAQTLLLIVHRLSGVPMSAAFKSHAFAAGDSGDAQVAVIDASQGLPCERHSAGKVNLLDFSKDPANRTMQRRAEPLPMNAVVAVSPGFYRVSAAGKTSEAIEVRPRGSYVVLRVGAAELPEPEAPKFPEEFVVFPSANDARRVAASSLLFAALLALLAC